MKLFKRLFGRNDTGKKTIKTFRMSTTDILCVGDKYEYTIEGNTRKEAFNRLVLFFYGKGENKTQPVKQDSFIVSRPYHNDFYCDGMPDWFGRIISGNSQNGDYEKLKSYAAENNLDIKIGY